LGASLVIAGVWMARLLLLASAAALAASHSIVDFGGIANDPSDAASATNALALQKALLTANAT
jgi:hypothetical protein